MPTCPWRGKTAGTPAGISSSCAKKKKLRNTWVTACRLSTFVISVRGCDSALRDPDVRLPWNLEQASHKAVRSETVDAHVLMPTTVAPTAPLWLLEREAHRSSVVQGKRVTTSSSLALVRTSSCLLSTPASWFSDRLVGLDWFCGAAPSSAESAFTLPLPLGAHVFPRWPSRSFVALELTTRIARPHSTMASLSVLPLGSQLAELRRRLLRPSRRDPRRMARSRKPVGWWVSERPHLPPSLSVPPVARACAAVAPSCRP